MKTRKRKAHKKHLLYKLHNRLTDQDYIGVTALIYNGNANKTLHRRFQKHVQRANAEKKQWQLSKSIQKYGKDAFENSILEIFNDKAMAHKKETRLINRFKPKLNTLYRKS
jgi:group I intron endonuclease